MKHKLVLLFTIISLNTFAQFFQGWGLMGGLTACREKWWINHGDGSSETAKKKFVYRFNGCVFAEMVNHEFVRWRTEIQYNQKGFKEKISDNNYKNKLDNICWNNFLILRSELFSGIPYFLIGPRVEYNLIQNTASPAIQNSFRKLHFSWSVGAGWEFIVFGNLKPMVELHYNPDINFAYKTSPLDTKNRAWELRVGIKFLLNQKSCPAVFK
jgi:opacity protein-like surface antigen